MPPAAALGGISQILGAPLVALATDATTPNAEGEVLGLSPVTHGDSASALLANLLPQASSGIALVAKDVYVGKGLSLVPAKVVAKIRRGGLCRHGLTPAGPRSGSTGPARCRT